MEREEGGGVQRYEDLAYEPTDLHKPYKKRKQAAFNAHKIVQKPPKKKVVQQKNIKKEIEEIIVYVLLMPFKKRSQRTPQNISQSSVTTGEPVKERTLRKTILPSKYAEEEEKEEEKDEVEVSWVRRTKVSYVGANEVVK